MEHLRQSTETLLLRTCIKFSAINASCLTQATPNKVQRAAAMVRQHPYKMLLPPLAVLALVLGVGCWALARAIDSVALLAK